MRKPLSSTGMGSLLPRGDRTRGRRQYWSLLWWCRGRWSGHDGDSNIYRSCKEVCLVEVTQSQREVQKLRSVGVGSWSPLRRVAVFTEHGIRKEDVIWVR